MTTSGRFRPSPLRRRSSARVAAIGLALSGWASGCAGPAAPTGDVDPALLQPLTALGPCPPAPTPMATGDPVPGLVLPDGAIITSVVVTDPVAQVQGWIPLTPIQVRVDYAERDDVQVIQAEDEVREAEVLVTTGDRRLFVKASAACDQGSVFVAVVAPEDDAGAVPQPAGLAPTGG